MRSIECGLGVLVMAAAVALASGWVHSLMLIPPIGGGAVLALLAFGAFLFGHGWIGRKIARSPEDAWRWRVTGRALFTAAAALALMAVVPGLMPLLDLFSLGGFPVGFYLAAQGGVIALAILAFLASDRLDAADGAEQALIDRGEA